MKSLFYKTADEFLQKIFERCHSIGVNLPSHWDIDHLCFRVENLQAYERYKRDFTQLGKLLAETPVAGRMISTFMLDQPIEFKQWKIELIELPAPKEGKVVREGFEHLEVVCDVPFSLLPKMFPKAVFDAKGLSKPFNPEYEMKLKDLNIKFHHLSLKSVVELEGHPVVSKTLEQLNLLEDYQAYTPLVAGTYPLGIATEQSDVDILLYAENLSSLASLEAKINKDFSHLNLFKLERSLVNELSTLFCSFRYNEISFELFAQTCPSVKQVAYQHFLCEEKILKYGNQELRERVRLQKSRGIKTEPAFAMELALAGDPYQRLLELQKISIQELREML